MQKISETNSFSKKYISKCGLINGKNSKNKYEYRNILSNSKKDFKNGYWVEVKHVTKNGLKTFIKHLNRYTSYDPEEINHTFTHVIYRRSRGYCLINFLNEKMADQLVRERHGVNWLGQIDTIDELEGEENDSIDDETEEEIEEEEEIEKEIEAKERTIQKFKPCEIRKKVKISYSKIMRLLRENPRKTKKRKKKYYFYYFNDTINAEKYFECVDRFY